MASHTIDIIIAETAQQFSAAKSLILDYVRWLNIDLGFQGFEKEMNSLPGMYNLRDGGLYIAYMDGQPVAVAGLRRFNDTTVEVKRMFVKDEAKGLGIGKLLLQQCIGTAKKLGYNSIKLDTDDSMKAAIHLYTSHGFVEISAYRFNPHLSARYFELNLLA